MIKPSFKAAHFSAPTPQGVASPFARFETHTPESPADRTLLMLLALGLMLLAFFVVLTSAATFDERRMRDVVQSVQSTFVPAKDEQIEETAAIDVALLAAVNVLRASVSSVFVGILPRDDTPPSQNKERSNPDRVEIDVPLSVFFADGEAILFPLPLLEKLVAVLSAPPAGYRMELVVRAAGKTPDAALDQARLAAFADGLVHRGLITTALSVGTLQNTPDTGARVLRFTFLLLNADDDLAAVRMMTGKGGVP